MVRGLVRRWCDGWCTFIEKDLRYLYRAVMKYVSEGGWTFLKMNENAVLFFQVLIVTCRELLDCAQSEMALCDALVSYLETTFMKGKDGDSDKKAAAAPTAAASAEFGGLKMVMKKRSDEDFIVMGKGKKGRGQKKVGNWLMGRCD